METNACECGCGREFEVEEPRRPGRPRRFFRAACRKRAERERAENTKWVRAFEGELHVESNPPTKQITTAVAEVSIIAGAFRRLAIEEPNPRLAAGCESLYLDIVASLDRNFPGWSS